MANMRQQIYPITAPIAPNSPALAAPMMMPASSTPSSTASTLDLKSISSRLAASVPVHAPRARKRDADKKHQRNKKSFACCSLQLFAALFSLFKTESKEFSDDWFVLSPYENFAGEEINKRYRNHIADDCDDVSLGKRNAKSDSA